MKNVLLLGNGIDRSFNSDPVSWGELLDKMTTNPAVPAHAPLPFPLEVVLRTNDHVDEALKEHSRELAGSVKDARLREVLTRLLTMGFDDILTTNYDYTLEATAFYPDELTFARVSKAMEHTPEVKRAEGRYMLHTYNTADLDGVTNRIWHIHGEARKPSGMVIGHYLYVNLVSKWKEKLGERDKSYKTFDQTKPSGCWLDSFIMGNVYVLGFGFDFSELDLWWLVNRKKREKAEPHGKVIFYTPENNTEAAKYALLSAYGVEIRHLGFKLLENSEDDPCEEDRSFSEAEKERIWQFNNKVYADFYLKAMEDINREMSTIRTPV